MIPPRLQKLVDSLAASYWFLPSIMLGAGVTAGIFLPSLDAALAETSARLPSSLNSSASGARSILTASATALATVLAVAFAMTMLTVQIASTQFTSRVLRRFMRDGITKFVLGLYLSTVAFLLLVLRAIRSRSDDSQHFVPSISVLIAIVLTLACLAALVVTLHRTTRSLQAATLISSIGKETLAELRTVWLPWRESEPPDVDRTRSRAVLAIETGYVQVIDTERVVDALPAGTTWLTIERPIGSFVFPGIPLFTYGPAGDSGTSPARSDMESMHQAFAVGRERTLSGDPLYGVRQLVDIALKALSPAVNDPTTAVMVVNELSAVVAAALRHPLPVEPWAERTIRATRVFQPMIAIGPLLNEAYDELVDCARSQPRVIRAVVETLCAASDATQGNSRASAAVRLRVDDVRASTSLNPGWRLRADQAVPEPQSDAAR